MKKILLLGVLLSVGASLYAQSEKISPAYWVVETNIHQKTYSIVKLYDLNDRLIQEVRMDGIYLDVSRSKHRKMLNELIKGHFAPLHASGKQKRFARKRV